MKRGPLSPRAFCEGVAYPWPFVVDLSDGTHVTACYLVHDRQRGTTKHDKPFLRLLLGDRTGRIEAKVWDDADRWAALCAPEAFIGVRGRVSTFRDELQLTVDHIEPLELGDGDLDHFLPASPRERTVMERELGALIASVEDPALSALLKRCLGPSTPIGRAFRAHPAAKRNHHAYIGGLLEHSVSVATIAGGLAAHYASQGAKVDRDLVVAGALLHDIGKVKELKSSAGFDYTTAGRLLGHIVIGIRLVEDEAAHVAELDGDRLLALLHLIASHQGKHEWASPTEPQMLEALVLHYADDLDSKMNPAIRLVGGVADGEWSEYDKHLGRALFQPPPLPATGDVEPVPADEAIELMIDLFRS
jgi:3'-5' exoribonuclease